MLDTSSVVNSFYELKNALRTWIARICTKATSGKAGLTGMSSLEGCSVHHGRLLDGDRSSLSSTKWPEQAVTSAAPKGEG